VKSINWIDLMRSSESSLVDTLESVSTTDASELESIFNAGIDAARQGLSALSNPFLLNGDSERFNAWTDGYYAMLRSGT